jgi:hypothetical protein
MKRFIGVILCVSVLMIACNKKERTETTQKDFPKTMYVNATDGLRVRNSPDINGEKLGLLDYLAKINITREDNNTVNIGGIDGKWVYITEPIEGWVFDGFLVDYEPHIKRTSAIGEAEASKEQQIKEKIIGNWRIIEIIPYTEKYDWVFSSDKPKVFFSSSLCEFYNWYGGYNWVSGKNTIKLIPDSKIMGDFYFSDINFIDDDHITFYDELLGVILRADYSRREKHFLKLERVK